MYGETVLIGRGALVDIQAGGEDDVKPIRVITLGIRLYTKMFIIRNTGDCRL